jgi:AraC-like DNA-binding protein
MKIKSKKELWDQCLYLKHRILRKSEAEKNIYWGMCYCGIQEYIVPIISHHTVIGVICVGAFCTNLAKSENRIKKVAKDYDFDKNELINAFYQSVSTEVPDINLIKALVGIVCENLISFYKNLQPTHNALTSQNSLLFTNEKFILYHVKEYIQQYFTEQIRVNDIADFCHCSESYVNHIFKKNTGLNIRAYINTYRMNLAKTMLKETEYSIAEISSKIGFNDPNYFTTVFSRSIGMSPTIFRKQL